MATVPTDMRGSNINSQLGVVTRNTEQALMNKIYSLTAAPSQEEMLKLQMEMQQWTIFVQLQSTLQKEVADAIKGIISKI